VQSELQGVLNRGGVVAGERCPNNNPEWVCLPKNHEKHAGNDNDGRYGAYHGIMRQRQRRSDQETGTDEYDRLLERTNTKILRARTNGGRKTHSHT